MSSVDAPDSAEVNLSIALTKLITALASPSALTVLDTPQETLRKNKKLQAQYWETVLVQTHLLLAARAYKFRRYLFSVDDVTKTATSVALCGLRSPEPFFARQAAAFLDFIAGVRSSSSSSNNNNRKERKALARKVSQTLCGDANVDVNVNTLFTLSFWDDLEAGAFFIRAFCEGLENVFAQRVLLSPNVCYFCETVKDMFLADWKKYADTALDPSLLESLKKKGGEDAGPLPVGTKESGLQDILDDPEGCGSLTLLGVAVRRLGCLLRLDPGKYLPIVHTAVRLSTELGKEFLTQKEALNSNTSSKKVNPKTKKISKSSKKTDDDNDDVINEANSDSDSDDDDDDDDESPLAPLIEPLTAIAGSSTAGRSLRTQALEALVWVVPTALDFAATAKLFAALLNESTFFFGEAWKAVNGRLARSPELGRVVLALVARTLGSVTNENRHGLAPVPLFKETWRIVSLSTPEAFADLVDHTIQLLGRPLRAENSANHHEIKRIVCEAVGDNVGAAVEKHSEDVRNLHECIFTVIFTLEGLCSYEPESLCSAALAGLGKIAVAYPPAGPHVRDFVLTLSKSADLAVIDEVTYLLHLLASVDVEEEDVKKELLELLWN